MNQRLIDANKIEFNTVRYPIGAPWPPNKGEQATMGEIEWVSKYQIENQPTINAIPIEWLEKWLSKKVFVWDATTMKYEKDRLQAIENIKYGFETMLEDWRRENE